MQIVLQILGVLFLLLVLLIAVAWWGFKYKLHKALDSLGDMKYAYTPSRLHLVRAPEGTLEWKDPAAVRSIVDALTACGFRRAGEYGVEEMDWLRLEGLANEAEAAYAAVYEHDKAGVWLDLVSRYADGGGVTYTTAPMGSEVESRPGQVKVYAPGSEPGELYRRFLAERPADGLLPASTDAFVETFERAYAEAMDWRNARGGSTEEEIRRIAAASGEELTDEMVAEIREQQRAQAVAGLEEALLERFTRETRMSVSEWEAVEDRLVFIHDRLTADDVAERFYIFQELDDDDEAAPSLPESLRNLPPREAFAALNELAPPGRRFEKIGELREPVAADIYVAPETPDD